MAVIIVNALTASADPITYSSGTLSLTVPDAPNLASSSITVSGHETLIGSLSVTVNVSGGYNADLYGYLTYNNQSVVLVNRIGITGSNPYGASGAGMNVTFSDAGALGDIHAVGLNSGLLSGNYAPDGRTISPLSTGLQFDAASRQNGGNPLATFNNLNPNGVWTLYFGDFSGGEQSTLTGWSLNVDGITPVPEPITWALGIFGGIFGGIQLVRRMVVRKT